MFDRISLKSMCAYEKLTQKNAMELFSKTSKSATDLRDIAFLIKHTSDASVTMDVIEGMNTEEFKAVLDSISDAPVTPAS